MRPDEYKYTNKIVQWEINEHFDSDLWMNRTKQNKVVGRRIEIFYNYHGINFVGGFNYFIMSGCVSTGRLSSAADY